MIASFTLLLGCQLAGELTVHLLHLPFPGPVIGMTYLLAGLLVAGKVPAQTERVAQGLLQYLLLLFVPAMVGIIAHIDRLAGQWLAILAASLGGIVATSLTTAFVFTWVSRLTEKGVRA
ncbi:CidA/LrgA family protein [Oleomonas cavernae]|uniref:CidA/LrgA family protein n=1 Tax=Oleomonas cavernae TaxID=2320859 RepID=A0A418WD93_9PROT|nr:CidA/LrgA family protein [Oleomonas cavernae]RJF87983.1 CidA/LrgA family protein [Oleomonas cavernae]